ncbi:cation:proton antiporter, partial [Staphylococcus epidermidis]
ITSSLTKDVLLNVLSWQLVVFSIVMILLVRPISVIVSTFRTEISKRERASVTLMAPRGIVVLTVAQFFSSLFMDDGVK